MTNTTHNSRGVSFHKYPEQQLKMASRTQRYFLLSRYVRSEVLKMKSGFYTLSDALATLVHFYLLSKLKL